MKASYPKARYISFAKTLVASRLCWMAVLAIGGVCPPCAAVIIDARWDGGGGNTNWDNPDNWDVTDLMGNPIVPDNGNPSGIEYNVIIDDNPGATLVEVTADRPSPTIKDFNNLTVNLGDTLSLPDGGLVIRGSITNNGLIALGAVAPATSGLSFYAPITTITGSGTMTLGLGGPQNTLTAQVTGMQLYNGASHTISGAGRIYGTGLTLTNFGAIVANVPNAALQLEQTVINNHEIRATKAVGQTSGGKLQLANGTLDNTSGLILAEDASTVEIASGAGVAVLLGGTLRSAGSGVIKVYAKAFGAQRTRIEDVTLDVGSHMQLVANGGDIQTKGTIINKGLIESLNAPVTLIGDLQLTGNGVFRMQFDSSPGTLAISAIPVGLQLTHDAGHTIEGTGTLQNMVIDNRGLIAANVRTTHVNRDMAIIDASGSTNSGTIRASNGARIHMQNATFTNFGTFEALDGGLIRNISLTNLNTGTLSGGTYRSLDSGSGATLNVLGTPVTTIAPDTTVELSGPNSVMTFGGTPLQTSLQNNSGTLKLSSGRLFTMPNSYTQSATGTLEIGLAPANSYGKLDTDATATLAGTLNVTLVNGFLPVSGNSFDILDWNTLTGTFSTLQLPTLEAGLSWDTSLLYTTGVLSVTGSTALPGDFNHDNAVNAADYVVWRKTNGTTAGFNMWRADFGNTSGSGTSSNSTVPEPAFSVLLMFAAAHACVHRRRPGAFASKLFRKRHAPTTDR